MKLEVIPIPKVIYLVGLPASGKSSYAKKLASEENAEILSSDELRKQLYGNENHQDNNNELFQELHKRAKTFLNSGKSVIIDATNISSKRRVAFVNDFKDYEKEAHYISKSRWQCYLDDAKRTRSVGFHVIDKMYKSLTIPTYAEGWDKIKLLSNKKGILEKDKDFFHKVVTKEDATYDYLFNFLNRYAEFDNIYELPHDSKWHSLSVSRHTYEVWKEIAKTYNDDDKSLMLFAAIFHDIGKGHCKEFKDGSKYANFISHEFVGGQLTCDLLLQLGYDDDFVLKVVELVQLHMRLLNLQDSEKGLKKLKSFVGDDVYNKLAILREADVRGH